MNKLARKILGNLGLRGDRIGLQGHVSIFEIVDGRSRQLFSDHNVIVVGGKAATISALVQPVVASPPMLGTLKLGDGGHVPGDYQTPLVPSANRSALTNNNGPTVTGPTIAIDPSGASATLSFLLNKSEGNGNGLAIYTEAGLFDADGQLFAYETFPGAYKDSTKVLRIDWTIFA